MMLEAMLLQAGGDKEKAEKLLAEARELMLQGLRRGGLDMPAIPGFEVPIFPQPVNNKGRLGVKVEAVFEDLDEKFKVPADRGVRITEVVPGSVVTLSMDGDEEKYLLGSIEERHDDLEVMSPGSPLGELLLGREAGYAFTYTTPTGYEMPVEILAVE